MVVDDDKNICELLRLYLEKEGYGVILAHDGEEAVVKFNVLIIVYYQYSSKRHISSSFRLFTSFHALISNFHTSENLNKRQ